MLSAGAGRCSSSSIEAVLEVRSGEVHDPHPNFSPLYEVWSSAVDDIHAEGGATPVTNALQGLVADAKPNKGQFPNTDLSITPNVNRHPSRPQPYT